MTIESKATYLEEFNKINILNIPFGYKFENQKEDISTLLILPNPDQVNEFNEAVAIFSFETVALLKSKYYFGIKQRSGMLEVLYNTFVDLLNKENKEINDFLTLQAVYADMVIKLGTFLEDFAGMCVACAEYKNNQVDIAETFLAYSNPIGFYSSIASNKGKRQIKRIFSLPESKGDIGKIFKNLTNNEEELIYKAVQNIVEGINDSLFNISSAILRNSDEDVTYYDMYNKLKHGFAPMYLFKNSMITPLEGFSSDMPKEELEQIIIEYFFNNLTIMHDKLVGQRTSAEETKYTETKRATPTLTYQDINIKTANDIRQATVNIENLYLYLMKRYLLIAENNKALTLLMSDEYMNSEERNRVEEIIDNIDNYK
ncbi:hypothetical protein ACQKOF_21510 [Lysinibacillus sp. NPDC093190]|uniref:hypothetical protein n=1 Tax=Lysinibacillus sp. NPDC093190 TaxID=3390575 RepID=UPI003CFED929